MRLTAGKELLDIVAGAQSYLLGNDEPRTSEEADAVALFFQDVQDYGELTPYEAGHRVSAAFALTQSIAEMEALGYWVFGGTEEQVLEGGIGPPSSWVMAIVYVVHKDNEAIFKFGGAQHGDGNRSVKPTWYARPAAAPSWAWDEPIDVNGCGACCGAGNGKA